MIRPDYTVEAAFCKNANVSDCEKSMQGTWLNYYDQALHVELENNMRFTANFRYNIRQNITKDPLKDFKKVDTMLKNLDDEGISFKYQFDSQCDETMIGFVHKTDEIGTMDNHKVSCFYAAKDKTQLYEDQVAFSLSQGNQTASEAKIEPPRKRGASNMFT